jgi:hypothetical protein
MTTVVKNNSSTALIAILLIVAVAGGVYLYRQHEQRTSTIELPGDNKIEITKPAD